MNEPFEVRKAIMLRRRPWYKRLKWGRVIGLICGFIILGGAVYYVAADVVGSNNEEVYTYVVKEGDTLWDIADKNSNGHGDIRQKIYNIQKMNHINVNINPLIAGQELTLVKP